MFARFFIDRPVLATVLSPGIVVIGLAEPRLPEEVRRQGLTVKKRSPSFLLVVNMISPDGSRDQLFLSNYATLNIKDELARNPGAGDVLVFGAREYSMRIWLDPDKL